MHISWCYQNNDILLAKVLSVHCVSQSIRNIHCAHAGLHLSAHVADILTASLYSSIVMEEQEEMLQRRRELFAGFIS